MRNCLEGGNGPARQTGAKYLVYRLPAESPLIGTECLSVPRVCFTCLTGFSAGVICLEEFAKGSLIARLSCLCTFHNGSCILAVR